MTKKSIGYPYTYGDELTLEMAGNNRKKAVSYSVLISSIWWQNLGFGEPIQSYSSFSNQPKTVIVRGVDTSRVNSISRGGDLNKSGPGPRAKADALKNARKTGGGSIVVEGFTPQRQYGPRSINKPVSYRNNVKINQEQFNGNQNPGNPGGSSSSMETMSRHLSQEYTEYQQKFNSPPVSKRFDTKNYDREKFKELAKDPKANKEVFHKTTVDEARTALQSEMEGIVDNPQRIIGKSVDLDFKVDGPAQYTHMDVKHPVGSEILRKQNSPYTLQEMAHNMGESIVEQKEKFCGLEQGPESSENVLHIIDLTYVPPHEKEIVKEYCIKGAGSSEGIKFLNDNDK